VLLLLVLLLQDEAVAMLQPGIRLVERPGVLHFYDGRRVVSLRTDATGREAIRSAIADRNDTEARRDAHDLLARLGLVLDGAVDGPESVAHPVAAEYVTATTAGWVRPSEAAERLAAQDVHVLDDPQLQAIIADSGLSAKCLPDVEAIAGLDARRSIVVAGAAPRRCLRPLPRVNEACVRAGITWLPIGGFDGSRLRVGPLVVPGQSACLSCAQRRIAANVAYFDLQPLVADAPSAPAPAALARWAQALAALVLLAWIGGCDVRLPGRVFTLGTDELDVRHGLVHRVPRCDTCAAPDYIAAAAPWEIARDH
jgi:bacteriocin biosynthesis cyclodehydratase domain-containing protein